MSTDPPARELTPLDLATLEPDLLGAVAMALYGRGVPDRTPAEPRTFETPRERLSRLRSFPPRA